MTLQESGSADGSNRAQHHLLAEVLCERLVAEGLEIERCAVIRQPFDHMASGLAATDVRQR